MTKNVGIDSGIYRDAIESLINLSLPHLSHWEVLLQPALSKAVDAMIVVGHVPIEVADAFFDVGHFCHRLAEDIMREREVRGLPTPPGDDEFDGHAE